MALQCMALAYQEHRQPAQGHMPQRCLASGRCAFVHSFPDLGAELRRIVLPMNRHSVLYRRLD